MQYLIELKVQIFTIPYVKWTCDIAFMHLRRNGKSVEFFWMVSAFSSVCMCPYYREPDLRFRQLPIQIFSLAVLSIQYSTSIPDTSQACCPQQWTPVRDHHASNVAVGSISVPFKTFDIGLFAGSRKPQAPENHVILPLQSRLQFVYQPQYNPLMIYGNDLELEDLLI